MLRRSGLTTLTRPSAHIQVRVCDAKAQSLSEITLALPIGATLRDALTQARSYAGFGLLIDESVAVGVFGKKLELSATLFDGDRVELYRALVVEPKVARRRRAAHRQKVRQTKNKVPITDRTV
jgi:putative ubiquitin-RnfH superfamily antitoxin RatB of RatAB toxin-antitoxin module